MAAAVATTGQQPAGLDERDAEPRTSIRRLGSTRKMSAYNSVRATMAEENRLIESHAETTAGITNEMTEFYRRRQEIEAEYSRSMDKLARNYVQKNKDLKHKREQWPMSSLYPAWQKLLENTKNLAKDHQRLSEFYGGRVASRMQRVGEDALRLQKKCKEIVVGRQDEVIAALLEATNANKAQATTAAELRQATVKFRAAYDQHKRATRADPPRPKKVKMLEKELEKRRQRYIEHKIRALRARSDYTLSLEAANGMAHRYFIDDISEALSCMEAGITESVEQILTASADADISRAHTLIQYSQELIGTVTAMDGAAERQRFIDSNARAFALPRRLAYQGIPPAQEDMEIASMLGDAGVEDNQAVNENLGAELCTRLVQLEANARAVRAECRENSKTLDEAERELIQLMVGSPEFWDVSNMFGPDGVSLGGLTDEQTETLRRLLEQEDYFFAKVRAYFGTSGPLSRLESKAFALRNRILPLLVPPEQIPPSNDSPPDAFAPSHSSSSVSSVDEGLSTATSSLMVSPEEQIRFHLHLLAAGYPLGVIAPSWTHAALSGLRHQGIFRVSGSHVEMQAMRAAFDRGEDPLANVYDASDINSVAGLLKMYLRELRPPILPLSMLDKLIHASTIIDDADFVVYMKDLIGSLNVSSMLTLRFIFSFLAHLAANSEYNMMDEWNLAICLGPTLMAAWGEAGTQQVTTQNLINEVIKRTIMRHMEVFPHNVAPHAAYSRLEFREPANGASRSFYVEPDSSEEEGAVGEELPLDDEYDDDNDDLDDDEGDFTELLERNARARERLAREQSMEVDDGPVASTSQQVASPKPPAPPERTSASLGSRLAEATPDLVLDLPLGSPAPATSSSPAPAELPSPPPQEISEPTGTADTFLQHRDTMKKKPRNSKTSSGDSGAEINQADEDEKLPTEQESNTQPSTGSPVPARNTARVAAKFAELTLTGGSLKPALAAKPGLLRRPTPHPNHANTPTKSDPPT